MDASNRHTFPQCRRVKRQVDFEFAFKRGRVVSDDMLVLHVVRSRSNRSRLGLSIPKRAGNSPQRNRWKRLIREAFRLNQWRLAKQVDVIARPRKGAEPDFHQVQNSLVKLWERGARATLGASRPREADKPPRPGSTPPPAST